MLTQLSTVKARLALAPADTTYDALLTTAIMAVSSRFDRETNRTLARTENATHQFDPTDTELLVPCYPIESVQKFELKQNESEGWLEQTDVPFLIRHSCILSLTSPFSIQHSAFSLCRVTYTGGYAPPGSTLPAPCSPLPADIEQAAVEQIAHWFQTRDYLGLKTHWTSGGVYLQFTQEPLLPSVAATLKQYERWTV
jgi:hypothetical protein